MSAISQTLTTSPGIHQSETSLWKSVKGLPISESFWFTTSLVLFVAMGPFAAIPALIAVFSLVGKQEEQAEPELS
jgi:hypothetical protein